MPSCRVCIFLSFSEGRDAPVTNARSWSTCAGADFFYLKKKLEKINKKACWIWCVRGSSFFVVARFWAAAAWGLELEGLEVVVGACGKGIIDLDSLMNDMACINHREDSC